MICIRSHLVPMLEICQVTPAEDLMVNMETNPNDGYFVCWTNRKPDCAVQLTRSFGPLGSNAYFVHYGTVPQTPPVDTESYILHLGIGKNSYYARRLTILAAMDLKGQETFQIKPEYFLSPPTDPEVVSIYRKLFTFVHVFQADIGKF